MSDDKKPTPEERVKAVEDRKAAKKQAEQAERDEQYATDREAIAALEDEKGIEIHYSAQVRQYVPGLPVVVGVRAPTEGEYKRLFSKMNRTNAKGDDKVAALLELAKVCWEYPTDPATRKAMIEANSGLLASVGNFANKLAEVVIEEEGKG